MEESRPSTGKIVSFVHFLHYGFGFPVHPFSGVLYFYRLHLHDLTLEAILHLMVFLMLCKCCLGVFPHLALWRWLFRVVLAAPNGVFPPRWQGTI
jgi:hypothetical protein